MLMSMFVSFREHGTGDGSLGRPREPAGRGGLDQPRGVYEEFAR